MFPLRFTVARIDRPFAPPFLSPVFCALAPAMPFQASAQSTLREFDTPEKVSVSITNRNGRVSVIAADEQKKVTVNATSAGAPVEPGDVQTIVKGGNVDIDVRARSEQNRIDVTVRVPSRSRVRISSGAGAVDVVGNVEFADVQTNTGTIHADVPLDRLNFRFSLACQPAALSERRRTAGSERESRRHLHDFRKPGRRSAKQKEGEEAKEQKDERAGCGPVDTSTRAGEPQSAHRTRRDSFERRSQHGAQRPA